MHPVLFHIGPFVIPAFGVLSAVGVLAGLFLARRTARILHLDNAKVWNLCVIGLFSALIVQRLLLVLLNWGVLRLHPQWMLALSMIHHPLLTGAGAVAGVGVAVLYALRKQMPLFATADALAAPLLLGLACEQFGALLAGSGYGRATSLPWAVTYTSPLAMRWSGTPLGTPLHPVQAYAGLAFLTLSVFLLIWLPARRQAGEVAGLALAGLGVIIYFTELCRDTEGRGLLLHGAIDGPQLVAIVLLLAGAWLLLERQAHPAIPADLPIQTESAPLAHNEAGQQPQASDEARHG